MDLTASDVELKRGIPVTSPCRTLVDLAGRLGPFLTEKTLDEGLIRRLWTVPELRDCLARARANAPGRAHLERMLLLRSEDAAADSMLEARAFRALVPLLPWAAHYQTVIDGFVYVLDAAWPDSLVCAEVVGRAHRVASLSAFDRERLKFNALASKGWRIAHLTATMSNADMVAVVRRLLGR